MRLPQLAACALIASMAGYGGPAPEVASGQSPKHIYFPEDVQAPAWIAARKRAQLATRATLSTFHDFTFEDRQPASGMSFLHRITDDAGMTYKAVHYDHGNGIAVADVDGDTRPDVYLVSQAGPNGLFRNLGNGRFADMTKQAGVALPADIGATASFADIDNDGDADLYVTNVRSPNRLFENLGDGTFTDITAPSGLGYNEHSSAAVFFDFNRDGLLDVFLAVIGEYTTNTHVRVRGTPSGEALTKPPPSYFVGHRDAFAGHLKTDRLRQSRLFRNLGGNRFADVTEQMGLDDTSWTGDATPTDFNQDGWPDLYVLNMQGFDQYWVNREGERFERQTKPVFPRTPWGSMGVKSFDYDNDGDLDLLLTDMHSDMSEQIGVDREKEKASWIEANWAASFLRSNGRSIYGNALFRNSGGQQFEDVSDVMNVENYWPWGVSVGDLNADGWQDVLITSSMNYPFRYGPNTVLLNEAGRRFVDAEYIVGVEPRRDGRTSKPWFRLDCANPAVPHKNCAGRSSELVVHGALGSRAAVLLDLDDDGDLDIVTNEFGDVPQVLISNLAERRNKSLRFLRVALRGTTSNRDALGARVTVRADDQRWVQVNDGQSGYLSQSRMPLYFGLADVDQVDEIIVRWPSGRTDRYHEPGLNREILLIERND